MGTEPMKVVYEKVIGGTMRLMNVTTPAGDQGAYIASLVPAGNPFWAWPTIPPGKIIACDFEGAPICADAAANNIAIGSITADPVAVLTYA